MTHQPYERRPIADPTTERSSLSVVAPCFNEEASLREFHARMTQAVRSAKCEDYEIVFVNDGSGDGTLATMRALADEDPRAIVVNLSRNYGHQLALAAGLVICTGARILIIDADLQDPPELLPQMMAMMDQGADVVYGRRRSRAGETAFKRASAASFYRLLRGLAEIEIPADSGDFRLMSRRAVDILNAMPERFRFTRGLVSWVGLRQEPILYDRDPRNAGATGYSLTKMIRFSLDAITSFSIVPLRIASVLGAATALCSLIAVCYTVGSWLTGSAVPGWTSLITVVLVLSSVELLVLGVIGEYLGRLYIESKHRPLFVIESIYAAARERQQKG